MASIQASCNKNKQHCCVPNCVSDGRYDDSIHFHHIPKDEDIKKQWIIKIRRDEGPLFKVGSSTTTQKYYLINHYLFLKIFIKVSAC